ncbi:VOC family protein [Tsukamurella sp. 8F]|uniref:VOC family protein n=1 Tax=unclassified Tsukamurella TaxID=2633480 RepID=UPI0023B9A032|nr:MULTISPECIES: VOC family protein [unclassified Tsukamurella]MDF0530395.1 VOC family protein [Tsukamurella sp. 8J]MDF0587784.1 VOC family protein [Tsukamurella sp. 8F]
MTCRISPTAALRIARPVRDLAVSERFWVDGVGMLVQCRIAPEAEGDHALSMVGLPGASWHLELVHDPEAAEANPPGPEDLLVLYLDGAVSDELVDRIVAAGGTAVEARNPYWNRWGVTIADPDGCLLVLSLRGWSVD